jgi:hypothetical protein
MADAGRSPESDECDAPKEPIVRLVLKATVANVESRGRPARGEGGGHQLQSDHGRSQHRNSPRLGLVSTTGFTKLMQENKDGQTFSNFG